MYTHACFYYEMTTLLIGLKHSIKKNHSACQKDMFIFLTSTLISVKVVNNDVTIYDGIFRTCKFFWGGKIMLKSIAK